MRLLFLDIETAPLLVYAWSLWDKYVPIERIVENGYTLCFAAQWQGGRGMMFDSIHKSGAKRMLEHAHRLLDEADAVCHFNGERFDIPVLRAEFIARGMRPPAPLKQIDLYKTVKTAAFPSRKLDYITDRLGLGQKVEHKGMELWRGCMGGDKSCWNQMERYNRQDVRLLVKLHDRLLPWIKGYPNRSQYTNGNVCINCGSNNLQSRGLAVSLAGKYARHQCLDCGKWQRSAKSEARGAGLRDL
jgi:hypothetical protein